MTAAPAPSLISPLRAVLAEVGVAAFLVPRADRHQGEYVPAADERLWRLTGFGGSAGMAVVLGDRAALFVDGRYELAAREEVNLDIWEIVHLRETLPRAWLSDVLGEGAVVGFDPWLHTASQIEDLAKHLGKSGITLKPLTPNPLDTVWADRPASHTAPATAHPLRYAGQSAEEKRAAIGETLRAENLNAAIITMPDSLCWLLNIRGNDVPHTPLMLSFGGVSADGGVDLFTDPTKLNAELRAYLGEAVRVHPWEMFEDHLASLGGTRVGLDRSTAPDAVRLALEGAGAEIVPFDDPCIRPKARKNTQEIEGARAAHHRDGAAVVRFLAWLDATAPSGDLTELSAVLRLRALRVETADRLQEPLQDTSFETISGVGPNGAIVHYRVNETSNRTVTGDTLLLVDSGGQYLDGTTDITRTVAIGSPTPEMRRAFTLVLKGMIAISRLRFPPKTAGREIDAIARQALWMSGLDYDHGTGHGIGSYLSVHEGPQGISKRSGAALETGMIVSNEPGYYKAGAFGIRIENLVLVEPAAVPEGGERDMHSFETLTLAPIDRRLVDTALLSLEERDWLNTYHGRVLAEIGPLLDDDGERAWLTTACAPI